jgi:hypothetical protein
MPNNTRWTKEEEGILKRHYPWIPSTELTRALPLRSIRSIQSRDHQKGLYKDQDAKGSIMRANRAQRLDRPGAA